MTDIPLQPVKSSNLEAIGYDLQSQTMRVKFKTGAVWDYEGVPLALYQLVESFGGRIFANKVRGVFPGTKVEAPLDRDEALDRERMRQAFIDSANAPTVVEDQGPVPREAWDRPSAADVGIPPDPSPTE